MRLQYYSRNLASSKTNSRKINLYFFSSKFLQASAVGIKLSENHIEASSEKA